MRSRRRVRRITGLAQAGLHAGNGHRDGRQQLALERCAAALLIMSDEKAKSLGFKPLVKIIATAIVGVDPCVMGTGPVPATKKH